MTIIRRDVKLIYDDPPTGLVATPPGSPLTLLGSGIPSFQGTAAPQAVIDLDFNDGTNLASLGLTIAGSPTFNGQLPYRKHSWVPVGGFDGGGFIRMTWFTGMSIGFSPVWVAGITYPTSVHYKWTYYTRQSVEMRTSGSNIKLDRPRNGTGTFMGTLLSGGGLVTGASNAGDWKWSWEGWKPGRGSLRSNTAVVADGQWHFTEIELDFRDLTAMKFFYHVDGVLIFSTSTTSNAVPLDIVDPNLPLIHSPFAEMFSCGDTGACSAFINSGTYDVDLFKHFNL